MEALSRLPVDNVVFPKLGIDLTINSEAISIFGFSVKWYGVMIALGMLLAMMYCFRRTKEYGIDGDRLIDAVIAGVIGAVVGATYPEMSKILRKLMPKTYFLVPGYGAQGGKGSDLAHFFNKDGLGAIVNSSRGIIAAFKQEKYAKFGAEHYAEASRQAALDMIEDINSARK